MGFRRRSDLELRGLDDEDVVAYLVAARDAGDAAEVKQALQILVYGRMDLVEAIVARSIPDHAVERVAQDAMIETMETVFEGRSVGQFVNLLKLITKRRVADFWKAKSRHGHEDTTLDADDEDRRRRELADPSEEVGAVPLQAIVDDLLAQLDARHRAVVELAIFGGLSAAAVAGEVNRRFPGPGDPMTTANVDQIKSRFRKTLRDELDDGNTS